MVSIADLCSLNLPGRLVILRVAPHWDINMLLASLHLPGRLVILRVAPHWDINMLLSSLHLPGRLIILRVAPHRDVDMLLAGNSFGDRVLGSACSSFSLDRPRISLLEDSYLWQRLRPKQPPWTGRPEGRGVP